MIYLLLYKAHKGRLWDRFVAYITSSAFSHIEVAFYKRGTVYRCWSSSSRDGGIREKELDVSTGKWVVIPLSIEMSEKWFLQHENCKYDYIGLIGTVIPISFFSSKNRWFCSEAVAEFLGLADSWKYTPEDLYQRYK